jgi:pilus assembly protein Flp/PilA
MAKLVSAMALRDEEGQTYVEYALLIAFIAIVALVAVQLLGHSISSLFSSVGSNL